MFNFFVILGAHLEISPTWYPAVSWNMATLHCTEDKLWCFTLLCLLIIEQLKKQKTNKFAFFTKILIK